MNGALVHVLLPPAARRGWSRRSGWARRWLSREKIILIVCLCPCLSFGLDRARLGEMLTTAAGAQSNAYLAARQSILDTSKDALPVLAVAASDSKLTWQQRLVARICYERIVRANDLDLLRRYDWQLHPKYNSIKKGTMLGPSSDLAELGVSKCVEDGLW